MAREGRREGRRRGREVGGGAAYQLIMWVVGGGDVTLLAEAPPSTTAHSITAAALAKVPGDDEH